MPGKKPFPWWIVIAAAALLLVLGLGAWLIKRDNGPEKPAGAPLQASCRGEGECGTGLACVRAAPSQPGVCLGTIGFAACRRGEDCSPGLTCDGVTCRGGLRFAECKTAGDCAQGLTCEGRACLGTKGFAGCLEKKKDCAAGLSCVDRTCTDRTTLAQCNADTDCVEGEACVQVGADHLCLRRTGQSCDNPLECVSRTCGGDACQAGNETCLKSADCAVPFQCVSGHCLLPNGAACTESLKCQSGNCSDRVCASVPIPCGAAKKCPTGMVCTSNGTCRVDLNLFERIERITPPLERPPLERLTPPPGK